MPTTMPDWWTVPYPELTTVEAASAYIDAIGGSLSRVQENGTWVLSTGTQELVRAATPAELDTFVLGFALAHLICERHGPIARTEPAMGAAPPPPPASPAPVAAAAPPVSTEAPPPPPPPPPVAVAAVAAAIDDDAEPEHAEDDDEAGDDGPERTTTLSVVPDVEDEDEDEDDGPFDTVRDDEDWVFGDTKLDGESDDDAPTAGAAGPSRSGRRRRRRR